MSGISDDPRFEVISVYGTRAEISSIIRNLSGVSILDYGTDSNKDLVVDLKIRIDEIENLLPKINQGQDDLGAVSFQGVEASFMMLDRKGKEF